MSWQGVHSPGSSTPHSPRRRARWRCSSRRRPPANTSSTLPTRSCRSSNSRATPRTFRSGPTQARQSRSRAPWAAGNYSEVSPAVRRIRRFTTWNCPTGAPDAPWRSLSCRIRTMNTMARTGRPLRTRSRQWSSWREAARQLTACSPWFWRQLPPVSRLLHCWHLCWCLGPCGGAFGPCATSPTWCPASTPTISSRVWHRTGRRQNSSRFTTG